MKKVGMLFIVLTLLFAGKSLFAVSTKDMSIIINLAGKQRMLTQKMSKDVLLIAQGIESVENKKDLKKSIALFDQTLKGLMYGDKTLRLKKVDDVEIQKGLATVKKYWEPFSKDMHKALSGDASKTLLSRVAKNNMPLLKAMYAVVGQYVTISKKIAKISIEIAEDINLAGRQRMLTQKMSKEMLLIANQIDAKTNAQNLMKTKKLFDTTLNGLLNGDDALSLRGCKITDIHAQLQHVEEHWNKISPFVDTKTASDKKQLTHTVNNLAVLLVEMNNAVKLYERSAKKRMRALAFSALIGGAMSVKSAQGRTLNLSGKQRMLSQKMSKEALLVALGVDSEKNKVSMLKSAALYDKILKGLFSGDSSLGLAPSKDANIMTAIKTLRKHWNTFYVNVQKIAKNGDPNALSYVIGKNDELLLESNTLVQMYKKSNTFDTKSALSQTIDLAGKQRMLTQKMTKLKLLIVGGIGVEANKKEIQKVVSLFGKTLKGLEFGDRVLGLKANNVVAINTQLHKVGTLWNELKPLYLKVGLSNDELSQIVYKNVSLLKEMNKVVGMFEKITQVSE